MVVLVWTGCEEVTHSNRQRAFMKFYDCVTAPSPRRVRIFLAEKGLTVPTVQVDLRNGEQFTPAFRALNPDCMVPVLELDSGAAITDIIAICRYFEELHPDPPLMGRSAEERAVIESWLRRIEWDGIYAAQEAFRNATPGLKGRALPGPVSLEQIPALAERGRLRLRHFFAWLDARLADNEHVCGPHFTIADMGEAQASRASRSFTKVVQRRFDAPERQSMTSHDGN
jgi:glutathione S-transferase